MASGHAYSAGTFALELGGAHAGFVISAAGGEPSGQVVEEQPDGIRVPKHIGSVGYADIVIEVRAPMPALLENWVGSFLDGTDVSMDGALIMLDYMMKVRERVEWTRGLISEVTFPAADGSNKDAARIRVAITPELTRLVAGSSTPYAGSGSSLRDKAFLSSNFRFSLSGLEQASGKISNVSAISVTRRAIHDSVGEIREVERGVVLDVADVAIRVPQSEIAPYRAWFDDFVIRGRNDASQERTGSLTFLDPTFKNELMRIDLSGVGIFRITPERQEAGVEVVLQSKVELYCEVVKFGKIAAAPPTSAPPPPTSATDPVTTLAHAILATLRDSSNLPTLDSASAIADRLLSTRDGALATDDFERGRMAGKKWASEVAAADELETIAALGGRDDWKAIVLPDGHSLLQFLAASGDAPGAERGPVDLERDEFTAGIVASVAEVFRDVEPILRQRGRPDR